MMVPDSRRSFGEVPEDFRRFVIDTANKEETPVMKKRFTAVLIAAVLIIALACTAVAAIGLNRSAQFEAAKVARQTMLETYGLDPEALGMFEELVTESEGGWIIAYHPAEFEAQLGTYQVVITKDAGAVATWSHDGAETETEEDAGLEAGVWGHMQIAEIQRVKKTYKERRQEMIERLGTPIEWSLADRAALDEILLDAGVYRDTTQIHILPGEADIPEAEAVSLMKAAIEKKYGIPCETLDGYVMRLSFSLHPGMDSPCYDLMIYNKEEVDGERIKNPLHVRLESPSGEILRCGFSASSDDRYLPEGPLDAYGEAVAEYVRSGMLDRITDAAKHDEIVSRIMAAGMGYLLETPQDDVLAPGIISESVATAIARGELMEKYSLTGEMLSLFSIEASLEGDGDDAVWRVAAGHGTNPSWQDTFAEKLGEYQVTLFANTGDVVETRWSHDGVLQGRQYTEHELGNAPAWDATMIPWFLAFNEKRLEMEAEAERRNSIRILDGAESREYRAAYHALYRDAGFYKDVYTEGLPGEGDIPYEQALEIVREALLDEYGLTREAFEALSLYPSFNVRDPEQPVWEFTVFSQTSDVSYYVYLDGKTGEILSNNFSAVGNG